MRFRLPKALPPVLTMFMVFALWGANAHAAVTTNGCADLNQSCTLEELVGGGSITVDNEVFDSWIADDASSVLVDLTQIQVVALDDQPLNPGLQFNANGHLSTLGLDEIDLDLGYAVSTVDGSAIIKDNTLEIDQFNFGETNFGGLVTISEEIFATNGSDDPIGEKLVVADNLPPPFLDLIDSATFAPQASIFIETNIFVTGDNPNDTASLDMFTQRVSLVPEAEVWAMMVVGLVLLATYTRRSKRNFKLS